MTDTDLSDLISELVPDKKHVSDTLYYPVDIAPHKCIHLWAGVGSGKNRFIEHIINGCSDKEIPKLTVLLITSRKSKAIEILNNLSETATRRLTNAGNKYELLPLYGGIPKEFVRTVLAEDGKIYEIVQRSVACTNAFIKEYLEKVHDPSNPETHLWNRFDLIVWDEVHSLIADSTFQRAPAHVLNLMHETYRRIIKRNTDHEDALFVNHVSPRCDKLIAMTGTPAPLADLTILPNPHILDLLDKCISVAPRNIFFIDSILAQHQIKEQLSRNERILYFANHVSFPDALSEKFNISSKKLAVSFSDEKRRTELKNKHRTIKKEKASSEQPPDENDYERMVNVEKNLAYNSSIRPDIQLFFTTSKNKEGINIEDTDIRHVYIESHNIIDIQQMAGRIRSGAENVYIIMDAAGHEDKEHYLEKEYARIRCLEKASPSDKFTPADNDLMHFCKKHRIYDFVGNPLSPIMPYSDEYHAIGDFIDLSKSKSSYMEFNRMKNKYFYNRHRELARAWVSDELQTFSDAADDPEKLVTLFQQAFPGTQVHAPTSSNKLAAQYADDLAVRFNNGEVSQEEFHAIISRIDELVTPPQKIARRKSDKIAPNRVLHQFGWHYGSDNHDKASNGYSCYKITPLKDKNNSAA